MDNISEPRTEVESIAAPHQIAYANGAAVHTSISQEPIFQPNDIDSGAGTLSHDLENNVSFFRWELLMWEKPFIIWIFISVREIVGFR